MGKIKFTDSRGRSIVLYGAPFRVYNAVGFDQVGANNQMQSAPYQDGATFIDTVMDVRDMSIELKVTGRDEKEFLGNKQLLSSVFNPKLGLGLLQHENAAGKKQIQVVADGLPVFLKSSGNNGGKSQKVVINLIAPDPYWKSLTITEEPAFKPLFEFPFEGEFEMGMQRDRRIITNDGDAPAPIQVEFFGPALNPKIINNTTGEYIKVNQQLLEGERMLIDTKDGQKSVFFVYENGEKRNVFNWIDLSSSFFELQIGENDIEYTADSDIQGTIVNISYSKLYTAV